ncbi:MAG: MSMEG_0568 family radical SAM protein [Syntrophomonas sp.]|nr:MSMEG_0568 family radical SAM protein [Syntrophomonas sp.]
MGSPLQTKELMVELQSKGIRIDPGSGKGRQGGAGPANGRSLLFGKYQITVPTTGESVLKSPYALHEDGQKAVIYRYDEAVSEAGLIATPRFYALQTADGVPYQQIALLHGKDCLASTVIQNCSRWNKEERCKFCGIGTSFCDHNTVLVKTPQQLAEVAEAAMRLDGITHVTLTAGTTANPWHGIKHMGNCAHAIKEATGLPIHVQFEPVDDLGIYAYLKECGVDTIGMHLESFDQKVREHITPGKAKIPVSAYFEGFTEAVEVFGRNQVSTYIIIGLGEDRETTLAGCNRCIEMGVYPFVVPLRPVKGTAFADTNPPEPEIMIEIYNQVAETLSKNGLRARDSKAGCVRCGACSVLPAFEAETIPAGFIIKVAESEDELRQYKFVRREVFVREQGIFDEDDIDEHDLYSIPIIGIDSASKRVVGVVRCYPLGNGDWIGGRLAVLPGFRSGIGASLVRRAVEEVRNRGCRYFYAQIQKQNVRFFRRLGWSLTGKESVIRNVVHYEMQMVFSRQITN